ncbi:MAG TPA: hypothetical protein DC047_17835 [Blastocatellia bacterium]|nr:hypothetical protein [Blastocatellia bacterium]
MSRTLRTQGALVASALRGAWRAKELPPFDLSEHELDQITPLLLGSGAAALGWRVVDRSALRESASGELLHQAYRLQSLQSEMQEQKIEKVFRLLREKSLDAILAKGWAAAALYPNRTLRPYGDIDILVRSADHQAVSELFSGPEGSDCWIDLHRQFSEIGNRTVEELFSRSKMHRVGPEEARVLGDEDHVALLCIHLLKHGGWRPLWLCDVAAAMEAAAPTFDWELCLGRDPIRASWIQSAFGLARRLLGASTDKLPSNMRTLQVPEWLVDTVLQQWANPFARYQAPMNHPVPMADAWRRPSRLIEGLRQRWPNPILATISVHGRLNDLPRLPYQLANCVARAVRFVISGSDELEEH